MLEGVPDSPATGERSREASRGEQPGMRGMRDTNTAWRQETAMERQQRLESVEVASTHQIDVNSFETLLMDPNRFRNRSQEQNVRDFDQSRSVEQVNEGLPTLPLAQH